jgi:hypothetical protein
MNHHSTTGDRVAFVVIHGMGEQKPMDTLRGFVNAVWQRDDSLFWGLPKPRNYELSDVWSEPDDSPGATELRRITTHHARSLSGMKREGIRVSPLM